MLESTCNEYIERLKLRECPDATFGGFDPPLVLDQGLGSQVKTVSGQTLIDLCAGFGVLALGHNHPRIIHRMQTLLSHDHGKWPSVVHGMGDVYPSRSKVDFFETLFSYLPSQMTLGALALSGSQAVEIAIKTSILHTKKAGFITIDRGYHGLDLGTLPVTSQKRFRDPFGTYLKSASVSIPVGCSDEIFHEALSQLNLWGVGFAGFILEPVMGRAGVLPIPEEWIQRMVSLAKSLGGVVILDEIFCGLGRTGTMTHSQVIDTDLICLGKALGGGLPLSVCVGKKDVMSSWPESEGEALHTGTFFGHPLACEMASETLKMIDQEDLCTRSQRLGREAFQVLSERMGNAALVRGKGLMIGIDYQTPLKGLAVMNELRRRGVLALVSGTGGECLSLTPPLNIPEDLLWSALDQVVQVSLSI